VSQEPAPVVAYEHVRAAHLGDVQAALEDHVVRLDWSREQIDHYRTQRLRALIGYARERRPFMRDVWAASIRTR
jgi:phenylacetate-CoA ligase